MVDSGADSEVVAEAEVTSEVAMVGEAAAHGVVTEALVAEETLLLLLGSRLRPARMARLQSIYWTAPWERHSVLLHGSRRAVQNPEPLLPRTQVEGRH